MQLSFEGEILSGLSHDVRNALRVIKSTYGDDVSLVNKAKDLIKYGRNQAVGTSSSAYTLMTLAGSEQHETYVSTNILDTISSSSASDDQEIKIEGHTIDANGNFTFVVQSATLNGQGKVTLSTPLARCTQLYNNNGTDLQGAVYCYQDQTITAGVPQTANKVHCIIRVGKNQAEKASTTISNNDYWIVTSFSSTLFQKSAAFSEVGLEIREKGKVFRQIDALGVSSGNNEVQPLKPCIIVPSNADVRLVAIGSGAGLDVGGTIRGYLAKVS